MTTTETDKNTNKQKTSTPPDGYVCNLCNLPGHWIQQCSMKRNKKRKNSNPNHIPVPGVDPSDKDIELAKRMQKIPPPNCFCGIPSRIKKVKKSPHNSNAKSRAIGKYFFFCTKKKVDNPCRFARLAEEVQKEYTRKNKRQKKKLSSSSDHEEAEANQDNNEEEDDQDGKKSNTTKTTTIATNDDDDDDKNKNNDRSTTINQKDQNQKKTPEDGDDDDAMAKEHDDDDDNSSSSSSSSDDDDDDKKDSSSSSSEDE